MTKRWFGRVWLDPPYDRQARLWLARSHEQGDGIALVFARTETKMFFDSIWPDADGIAFIRGRLAFYACRIEPDYLLAHVLPVINAELPVKGWRHHAADGLEPNHQPVWHPLPT